ncbi:MAG: hypothetical protein JWO36_5429 [Myxococcales bacterium]|nr:hypothetical protein [Myxococcales bacterium]
MVRAMRILFLSALLWVGACGPAGRDHGSGNGDAGPGTDGTGSGSNGDMSRVYAHSGTKLYRIDTQTLQPVEIGPLTNVTGSLTDLAIDKSDRMVGVTLNKLFSIDPTTGTAILIKALSGAGGYTSLSYVPSDLNDPNSTDILVTANDQGDVFQIDPTTGNLTKIGSYGTSGSNKVISSGDLIGVRGLGIYATVDVGTQPNDYLASIDPATWKATPIGTGTGYNNIFGLGFWAGTIYGFVDAGTGMGKIIKIDPTTGAGSELNSGAIQWFGAGVSTDAPIIQ